MIETGTLLQDRYLIEKQIGAGGMGAVYLAVDRRFDNYVAIKQTFYADDEFGEAFEREARLLNGLQHPVLPHVTDFFSENNGHFLVMQYIEGEDLSETIKREGAFPVEDVLRWTDNLLDALDYLHTQTQPVIHRDIKPQNLKLTPRGGVILLDFGLAKLKHEDTTGVKSIFGYSRRYSPLEQIQGTGTDARSDIFSLGATVYQLLTGKHPIEVLARASRIIAGKPDPLQLATEINDKVPAKVAVVLHSALALNPEQRFASATAMRQALEHAYNSNPNDVPESASAVSVASVSSNIGAVEIENFPALEAFVDEVKNLEHINDDRLKAIQRPAKNEDEHLSVEENFQPSNNIIDAPIVVAANPVRSRFQVAALTVLLTVLAGAAAGYFIYRAKVSEKAAQTPVVLSSPEPQSINNQLPAAIPDAQTAEVPEPLVSEESEQAKNKTRSIEKTSERALTSEKSEILEEPSKITVTAEKTKTAPVETARPTSAQNMRKSKSEREVEARPRIVKSEPAPDIESIFTGRTSWRNDGKQQRNEERRQQRENMSDEEWQDLRRQRQEQRRKRQNKNSFPF